MTLQQEKSTKSLDNLFAVKKWSCIRLIWRTSNTNELCHPKFEKCLHHTADGLKQGAGSQGAAELMPRGDPAFLRDPSMQTHNHCQRKAEMPWQNSHSVGRTNTSVTNTLQKTFAIGGDSTPCSMQSHHGEVEDDSPYFLLSFYRCCSSSTKAHFWLSLTGSCLLTATGFSSGFDTGNGKASRCCNPHSSHVCFSPHNPRARLSIADMPLSLSSSCETAWGAIPDPSARWSREAQKMCPTVGILGPHEMIQDCDGIRSFGLIHLLCVTQTDGFIRLLEPGLGLKESLLQ